MNCVNCGVPIMPTAGGYTHVPDTWTADCDHPSPEPSTYERPDRSHLKGKEVRLTLNPWASKGPTRGLYAGDGERGLTIIAPGGGRYVYSHHEVADVQPVEAS